MTRRGFLLAAAGAGVATGAGVELARLATLPAGSITSNAIADGAISEHFTMLRLTGTIYRYDHGDRVGPEHLAFQTMIPDWLVADGRYNAMRAHIRELIDAFEACRFPGDVVRDLTLTCGDEGAPKRFRVYQSSVERLR